MKVQTSRFGEIEVDDADVISLPEGLVGFPELMRYVLLDHDADSPFKWLQSLDDGSMAFVVISPLTFRPDYTVEVTEEEISILKLQSPDDAVISVIVTIPSDPKKMSANLKAPLVFNLKNRTGKQVIVKDAQYQTKHFIMEEIKKYAKKDLQTEIKKAAQQSASEELGKGTSKG
ncbi:MAG: flagellar assembly protein FliW [Proteobacteria bacterium]|nr:flagellar assembly protein FliW [Pseudomonadota bacterium]